MNLKTAEKASIATFVTVLWLIVGIMHPWVFFLPVMVMIVGGFIGFIWLIFYEMFDGGHEGTDNGLPPL